MKIDRKSFYDLGNEDIVRILFLARASASITDNYERKETNQSKL